MKKIGEVWSMDLFDTGAEQRYARINGTWFCVAEKPINKQAAIVFEAAAKAIDHEEKKEAEKGE